MAKYIDIICSVEYFCNCIKNLSNKYGISMYIEKYKHDSNFRYYIKPDDWSNLSNFIDSEYYRFYFSTLNIDVDDISKPVFYQAGIYEYSIEGIGGRNNVEEIELLSMRLMAKNPDKLISSFFNSIQRKLNKDPDIGKGFWVSTSFYKKKYYSKESINGRTAWLDFHRKKFPIKID
jgi:hypothetical protein